MMVHHKKLKSDPKHSPIRKTKPKRYIVNWFKKRLCAIVYHKEIYLFHF